MVMSDAFQEIEENFKAQVNSIREELEKKEAESPKPKKKQITYRIKAVDKQNETHYFPQYKFLFLWFTFEDAKGAKVSFPNIMDAKKFIEFKHKMRKKKNIRFIPVEPREDR